jgi:hypothetical protein
MAHACAVQAVWQGVEVLRPFLRYRFSLGRARQVISRALATVGGADNALDHLVHMLSGSVTVTRDRSLSLMTPWLAISSASLFA